MVLLPVVEGKTPDGTSLALIGEAYMQLGDARKADAAFAAAGWAKSDGVQYYDTTLEVIKRWDATLAEWTIEAAPARWEDLRINQFAPRASPVRQAVRIVNLSAWAASSGACSRSVISRGRSA